MQDVFELFLFGFNKFMEWMGSINYQGISILNVCYFCFFFSLVCRFVLNPVFSGSGMSIGVSDLVRSSKSASSYASTNRTQQQVKSNNRLYYPNYRS